ncbi:MULTISPECIES: segregation/condensation protein A [unclassified Synechococcus]|uniref:segregation/condensation protein A n=1 Tax=unclassified Synechococcus TaxID=2626047 RepID=UPI0000698566|nr:MULTISPECIES: segregation/condensation protein A [unclassified Synechococcus]EAQ75357.1 putative segregation and condensation protein A [Synechococcus sp. WH 5701]WFN59925.1 segregation/condensation protein A [Synechococcus sp. CCFWC 502]
MAEAGARLAIRLLQDAAERGEIDPWDVDVIAVVDGFLDQLRQRIGAPRLVSRPGEGGSFENDLAATSEAFLAASVLVSLKAEILEQQTLPPEPALELDAFGFDDEDTGSFELLSFQLPRRPERHLLRRAVAPPPLQRPVTLGELIRQLEDIAERLEQGEASGRTRQRGRRYSERAAIEQVAALAHREKLPETTAALSHFLMEWQAARDWVNFEVLVEAWAQAAPADLDQDRVGVFWALLFLCSQGRVDLQQEGDLFGPLFLKGCWEGMGAGPSVLPHGLVPAPSPAREAQAA